MFFGPLLPQLGYVYRLKDAGPVLEYVAHMGNRIETVVVGTLGLCAGLLAFTLSLAAAGLLRLAARTEVRLAQLSNRTLR